MAQDSFDFDNDLWEELMEDIDFTKCYFRELLKNSKYSYNIAEDIERSLNLLTFMVKMEDTNDDLYPPSVLQMSAYRKKSHDYKRRTYDYCEKKLVEINSKLRSLNG